MVCITLVILRLPSESQFGRFCGAVPYAFYWPMQDRAGVMLYCDVSVRIWASGGTWSYLI